MPTKKPKIQIVIEDEIYEKFKKICEKEERSESKMGSIIIKKYVENYEKEEIKQAEKEKMITNTELLTSKIG